MPHLLWHGTFVYNGHPWGPVTLTPVVERLTVELSLPVLTTCCDWDLNTQPSTCKANALTTATTAAVVFLDLVDQYTRNREWELLKTCNSIVITFRFICETLRLNEFKFFFIKVIRFPIKKEITSVMTWKNWARLLR